MKINKKIIVAIIMTIIILISTGVNAANESRFTAKITSSKEEIKQGDEITVTMSVSDIEMGENGINTIEGTIDYDRNVFEEVKSKDVEGLNNWNITYNDEYGERNGKFLSINLSQGIKEYTEVFRVTLRAKADISRVSETTINFKDITSNDGTNLVNVGDKNIKIKISSDGTNQIENESEEKSKNEVVKIVTIATSVIATILIVTFGIKRLR